MSDNFKQWLLSMASLAVLDSGVKARGLHIDAELPGGDTSIYVDFEQQGCASQNQVDLIRFTPDGTLVQKMRVKETLKWYLRTGTAQRAEDLMEYFSKRHEGHEVVVDGLHAVRCVTCDVAYQPNWAYGWIEALSGNGGCPIRSPNDERLQWGVPDHSISVLKTHGCLSTTEWAASVTSEENRAITTGKMPGDATTAEIEEEALYGVFYTYIYGLPY